MLGLPQILVSKCSFFLKCRLILLELGKEKPQKKFSTIGQAIKRRKEG